MFLFLVTLLLFDCDLFLFILSTCNVALEPFFSAAASQFILGHQIPLPLWLSLAPVVFGKVKIRSIFFAFVHHHCSYVFWSLGFCLGVSMASLTELSFNWTGFISAMISNISFTYRSIYSKKAMVMILNFSPKVCTISSTC